MVSLPTSQIGSYPYNTCNDAVQNSLVNFYPTFFDMDESDMFKILEKIVTKV